MARASRRVTGINLFAYRVGFGDCFLLRFEYGKTKRHVLVDFGSRKYAKGGPDRRKVAQDIAERCDGKLDAIVATHRHGDHVNGFATRKDGKGTGDLIRSLSPELVVQPWTEHPEAALSATAPPKEVDRALAFRSSLHALDADGMRALRREAVASVFGARVADLEPYVGEDDVKQKSAVENLMSMAENDYVYFGCASKLEKLLPGVGVRVLGPPTLEQHDDIRRERHEHPEFWMMLAGIYGTPSQRASAILSGARYVDADACPASERSFVRRMQEERFEQLRTIVTALDDAMNNTSVILLFEIGKHRLLFSGDAQIECWQYALEDDDARRMLADTTLYKVGHHGSRNATPRSLWDLFGNRGPESNKDRLVSLLSTEPGFHGSVTKKTEVPRRSLVDALRAETELHDTTSLKGTAMGMELEIRP